MVEWLAGFFDGEGCVKITVQRKKGKEYPHASIMLSQSGENGLVLLKEIQDYYGGKIYQHLVPGQHKATKPAYKLYWNKQDGIAFLKLIIPHLRLKQQEAKDVLAYLERK